MASSVDMEDGTVEESVAKTMAELAKTEPSNTVDFNLLDSMQGMTHPSSFADTPGATPRPSPPTDAEAYQQVKLDTDAQTVFETAVDTPEKANTLRLYLATDEVPDEARPVLTAALAKHMEDQAAAYNPTGGLKYSFQPEAYKFMKGAERWAQNKYHGAEQFFNMGLDKRDEFEDIGAREAEQQAEFDEGGYGFTGWLGESAPEAMLYTFTKGKASTTGLVAATSAFMQPLQGEEALGTRVARSVASTLLSTVGPKTAGWVIKKSFGSKAAQKVRGAAAATTAKIAKVYKGDIGKGVTELTDVSERLLGSPSKVARAHGAKLYADLVSVVQQMNSRGKTGVVMNAVDEALEKATKIVNGQAVLEPAIFVKIMQKYGKTQMGKELGRTFGERLNHMRDVAALISRPGYGLPSSVTKDVMAAVASSPPKTTRAYLKAMDRAKGSTKAIVALTSSFTKQAGVALAKATAADVGEKIGSQSGEMAHYVGMFMPTDIFTGGD